MTGMTAATSHDLLYGSFINSDRNFDKGSNSSTVTFSFSTAFITGCRGYPGSTANS
jgi:hypothetical protein